MYKQLFLSISASLSLLFALAFTAASDESTQPLDARPSIQVVTENFPPYNYVDKQGRLTGYATEILYKLLAQTAIDYEISVLPWKRAYRYATQNRNHLIYSISRTPQRESMFEWIGPVSKPVEVWFYKLKGNDKINLDQLSSLQDVRNYHIGVMSASSYFSYLQYHNFPNLHHVGSYEQQLSMLKKQRVDLIFMADTVFDNHFAHGDKGSVIEKSGLQKKEFEKVYSPWSVTEYIAINKQSNPGIVQQLKQAYAALKREQKISLY